MIEKITDREKLVKEHIYLANKIAFIKVGFFDELTPTEVKKVETRYKFLSEKLKVDKSE